MLGKRMLTQLPHTYFNSKQFHQTMNEIVLWVSVSANKLSKLQFLTTVLSKWQGIKSTGCSRAMVAQKKDSANHIHWVMGRYKEHTHRIMGKKKEYLTVHLWIAKFPELHTVKGWQIWVADNIAQLKQTQTAPRTQMITGT